MIEGSLLATHVEDIWACEFVEGPSDAGFPTPSPAPPLGSTPVITEIAYAIDNTTKTRAVFEIHKGPNKNPQIDVNSWMAPSDRRIPFEHMIYAADGPSDVPVLSVVKRYGGRTYGVYAPGSDTAFRQIDALHREGRIDCGGPSDYTAGSHSRLWLLHAVRGICDQIAMTRERAIAERVNPPPRHHLD
jgi:hypothetical protein